MDYTGMMMAFMAAVLMGTIGVFSKLTGLPAEIITFFRLFLGAVFMLPLLAGLGRLRQLRRLPPWQLLLSGVLLAGFIMFYVQAMNFTTMANAIMMVYLAPVAASLAAHFFLDEPLTPLGMALILMALLGFGMMLEFDFRFGRGGNEALGLGLGGLALACYAGFILVNRVIPRDIPVFTRAFYQLLVGGLVMIPLMLPSLDQVTPALLPWLAAVGLIPGFLALFFAIAALSRLPTATYGTIAYAEPVAVVLFGWLVFQERLGPLQLAGCLLIIGSGVIRALLPRG